MRPDFYIAAIGRSGSTLLCNWLTHLPDRLVFNEPFFCRPGNSRLLRIQLANFGLAARAEEWAEREETAAQRFGRLMTSRLKGRHWAFKEVLCEEHARVLATFAPPKVMITVRDMVDVALSFFEKHRVQRNLDRFNDDWVVRYCVDESAGIRRLHQQLGRTGVPTLVVRYEDFTRSEQARKSVEQFLGWEGGGDVAAHFRDFQRGFEIERHGTSISTALRERAQREVGAEVRRLAHDIAERCQEYQQEFGYKV